MTATRKQIKEFTNETELEFKQGSGRFNLFAKLSDFISYISTKINSLGYKSTSIKLNLNTHITDLTVLENNIPLTITWEKLSHGRFKGTFDTGILDLTKTVVVTGALGYDNFVDSAVKAYIDADGTIEVQYYENATEADASRPVLIEIRQYN